MPDKLETLREGLKRLTNDWPSDIKRSTMIAESQDARELLGLAQRIALNTKGVSRSEANRLIAEYHGQKGVMR